MQNQCTTKRCSKCGESKPETTEYFHRCKKNGDKLRPECKECTAIANLAYRQENREGIREQRQAHYQANQARFLEKQRIYRAANIERVRARKRAYYAANRQAKAEYDRVYRQVNGERKRANDRAHYLKNRDHRIEYARRYKAANPERAKRHASAGWHNRRARLLAAPGAHTAADVRAQHKAQRGKCYYCAAKVGKEYHVDHIIPLSRGGSNGPENIVIACATCNLSKHNKLPTEWDGNQSGRLL